MEYQGKSLEDAANTVIQQKLVKAGGDGGIIAIDKSGNITFSFNTKLMFRGFATSEENGKVYIFK